MILHPFHHHSNLEIFYIGPHLSTGPLPTLFYFSLSAKDSLMLDPFNQPVTHLSALPMRIFSLSLPGHEKSLPPIKALNAWASEFAEGKNPIEEFIAKVKLIIQTLRDQDALIEGKLAIAGLSRGAFCAAHVAAAIPEFRWILGFAPLTKLSYTKEFQPLLYDPLIESLNLIHLKNKLSDRSLRFYIGNLDTRVSTRFSFDFIEALSLAAFANQIRSPSIELIITPSIGRDGHGTSSVTFREGAQWIAEKLGVIDVV